MYNEPISPTTAERGPTYSDCGGSEGFAMFPNAPCMWPVSMNGQPDNALRVHVVDGNHHTRGVLIQELMSDARTVVSGQADSVKGGRRLIREVAYDVMIVDARLQDGLSFDLITYSKSVCPEAEVIVISAGDCDIEAAQAFGLGASGFMVHGSLFVTPVQAVLQVANGGASVAPTRSRRLLLRHATAAGEASHPSVVRMKLSNREQEVLRLIADGSTSVQIGQRLSISCTTVNSHVKNLYQKLHVRSRAHAVSCASSWGLL